MLGDGFPDQTADRLVEERLVGEAVDHEARQRRRRVERDVLAGCLGGIEIDDAIKMFLQGRAMFRGGDNNGAVVLAQAGLEEGTNRLHQEIILFVELNKMFVASPV